jgi:hypothetical protein
MLKKFLVFSFFIVSLLIFGWVGALFSLPEDAIVVAKYRTPRLVNGLPEGWSLMRHCGTPRINLVRAGEAYYIHMNSDARSGFGIEKVVRVDLREYPYLNWTWRATQLPRGGDVRKSATDDQAIQIYVVLPATGYPEAINTPILTYIWDNEAPKGLAIRSPKPWLRKIRYLVVRNKTDQLGQWYTEKRNVYEDYKRIFRDIDGGEPRGATHGVRLYINSQNTRSHAEGFIGEVYFSRS